MTTKNYISLTVSLCAGAVAAAQAPQASLPQNLPVMVQADGHLRCDYGPETLVLPQGLQPALLRLSSGAWLVQGQMPSEPVPTARMHYPYALATVISRDDGATWTPFPLPSHDNGIDLEGGAIALKSGQIVGLDTYIVPGKAPGSALGELYRSSDQWRTLEGPLEASFDLPNADFDISKDDNGRPYHAERLHRRIIELPDGDLLTTVYGCMKGDVTPATYMPLMIKSRVMLVRSSNQGLHWRLVSTVAVDPAVGTEGFGEPVVNRVSKGEHAGRLICLMRTGRNLYEADSDDTGLTWTKARPVIFGGIDVTRTEYWVDQFRHIRGRNGKMLDENNPDELQGAVVDPDLVELRDGLLVASFGIRIPQKGYKIDFTHPWNGNYLAVSSDHGQTWSNVIRLTSGIPTTHYTAIEETSRGNQLFVVYDHGFWGRNDRYLYGRTVTFSAK